MPSSNLRELISQIKKEFPDLPAEEQFKKVRELRREERNKKRQKMSVEELDAEMEEQDRANDIDDQNDDIVQEEMESYNPYTEEYEHGESYCEERWLEESMEQERYDKEIEQVKREEARNKESEEQRKLDPVAFRGRKPSRLLELIKEMKLIKKMEKSDFEALPEMSLETITRVIKMYWVNISSSENIAAQGLRNASGMQIRSFLDTAVNWKGEIAERVKAELNSRIVTEKLNPEP